MSSHREPFFLFFSFSPSPRPRAKRLNSSKVLTQERTYVRNCHSLENMSIRLTCGTFASCEVAVESLSLLSETISIEGRKVRHFFCFFFGGGCWFCFVLFLFLRQNCRISLHYHVKSVCYWR